MTDQSAALGPARVARAGRLIRRFAGGVAALVGLVTLITGITLTASQTWPTATGTVQSCSSSTSPRSSGTTVRHTCQVAWVEGGREHSTSVDFGSTRRSAGDSVDLRVKGDEAVVASPAWVGYLAVAGGLLLLVGGVFFLLRKPRSGAE